jgi:hypothetical protein
MFSELPVDVLVNIAAHAFRLGASTGMRFTSTCRDTRTAKRRIDGCILKLKHSIFNTTVVFVDRNDRHTFSPIKVTAKQRNSIHPSIVLAGNFSIGASERAAIEVKARLKKMFLDMLVHPGSFGSDECIATVHTMHVASGNVRMENLTAPRRVYVDPEQFRVLCGFITNRWFGRCNISFNTILALQNNSMVRVCAQADAEYCKEYERGPRDNNDYDEVVRFNKCSISSLTLFRES